MPVPEFIVQLREHVGHDRLFLTGVCAVVVRDDRGGPEILYGRRSDDGRWALPSGILEPGEQAATTVAREVWEELRVTVEPERLVLLTTDPDVRYPNGDVCQYVSLTFRCRYVSGEAEVGDDETLEVAWRPADDPPEELDERQRRRIAVALSGAEACVFDL
ncbi:NUDIX hydrolase [Microlunatus flavus]|uniref:ADP-ribose pyrophosphatase YjhB, NUDIX family n=1 Tax=Microlunatus flavus TaxID=1036181 RepID=A0A1H9KKQ5_9ACTN|nr:NUDIX domain-containing protein [Microlunatus flavus]SEQ99720.1 ADP-ribose pyrophosphatase YjhB, NUDIX family [Microlunatus flavus]